MKRHPLIITYTGEGKGKTTAALGMLLRTIGHGGKGAVIQFIKSSDVTTGEKQFASAHGVLFEQYGAGFTWQHTEEENMQSSVQGFERAREVIESGRYDLVILDEFTYPLSYAYLDKAEVFRYLRELKNLPDRPHIVITGRDADEELIGLSDLVSSIAAVKHPYQDHIPPQKGIEF